MTDEFELTKSRLVQWVVIALAGAVVFFIVAALTKDFWQVLTSGLASALVSIGLALIVTEIVLRPIFARDVVRLAQLKQRIEDIGLVDVAPENSVPWGALNQNSKTLQLVVMQPQYWLDRDLETLLQAARADATDLKLYLASPVKSAPHVARNLGLDEGLYSAEVTKVAKDVENSWKDLKGRNANSKLEIVWLVEPPSQFIGRYDNHYLIGVLPVAAEVAARPLYVHVNGKEDSDVGSWIRARLESLEMIREQTPAYISPNQH